MNKLLVKKLKASAKLPVKAHETDACFDVFACLEDEEKIIIEAGETIKVPLGIAIELPSEEYQAKLLPRSGLNAQGIITLTGTIDYGYTGEVNAIVYNSSSDAFIIPHGLKISQLDIQKVHSFCVEEVTELKDTVRGSNGFGSTGI